MKQFTADERSALIASAERKKRDAQADVAAALLKLSPDEINKLHGWQFTYTLTRDEFRAQFE